MTDTERLALLEEQREWWLKAEHNRAVIGECQAKIQQAGEGLQMILGEVARIEKLLTPSQDVPVPEDNVIPLQPPADKNLFAEANALATKSSRRRKG